MKCFCCGKTIDQTKGYFRFSTYLDKYYMHIPCKLVVFYEKGEDKQEPLFKE